VASNVGASLHDQAIERLDLGEFRQVLDLNVVSVTRAVLPAMRRLRPDRT
jgi:NADP-dependent 3-hydroxy acid dehydrogenase YdfG